MHKRIILTVVPLLATIVLAAPSARAGNWYVGGGAGAVFPRDTTYSGTNEDGPWKSTGENSPGYGLMLNGGYDFGGPKAELELGWRDTGLKSVTDHKKREVTGNTSALSVMANGLYSFLPQSSWHPFVGAGIGFARLATHMKDKDDGETMLNSSDWQFAYQGIAGLSYDISKSWAVNTQYRYFSTLDADYKDRDGGNKIKADYGTHAVLVGVTYAFGK